MKCRFKLVIMIAAALCLSLIVVAPAAYTQKTLYLDGQLVVDTNEGTYAGLLFNDLILVGAEGGLDNLYNEFVGTLDEFAVYEGILSEARIQAHYNAGIASNYAAYETAVEADSPLLWLKFKDASVANEAVAANSGSSATDGEYVITGGSDFEQVAGICGDVNSALLFPAGPASGAEGRTVAVPDNGEFGENLDGNEVTVEIWVKFTNFNPGDDSDWARFFSHGGGYTVMVSGPNTLGLYGGGAENYQGLPYDINDNEWHHVVVSYFSDYTPPPPPPPGNYVEEVTADNPVAWLRFDEEPIDSSGNNYWVEYGPDTEIVYGTEGIGGVIHLATKTNWVAAVANSMDAPVYDDINETYEIHGEQFAFAPDDITFEFWYKSPETGGEAPDSAGRLFQQHGQWGNEPNGPGMKLAGTTQVAVYGGDAAYYRGAAIRDKAWHQIVLAYDEDYNDVPGTMRAYLYTDGELRHTIDMPAGFLGLEMSHVLIGAAGDIGGSNYNCVTGYFDEFAIYEGVLPAERVKAHYDAWFPSDCAEAREKGGSYVPAYGVADLNGDCNINFYDFAEFATDWMKCNDPESSDPSCVDNW